MNGSIFVIVLSLVYIFVLTIIYNSKERINLLENRIFKIIMIINLIGLCIEMTCFLLGYYQYPDIEIVTNIVKIYLIYLFTFVTLFTLYIYVISQDPFEKDLNVKVKKIILILTITYIIVDIFIYILPITLINNNSVIYATGAACNLLYILISIYLIIWIGLLIKNYHNIRNKKYIPVFMFILLGGITMFIQNKYPELLLMTTMEAFIVFLMYHTIENPDVSLLREIANKKDEANRINNDKAMFLFNMSQDIKKPVMDIQTKCENALMGETVDEFKDGIRSIKESANQASRLINASLNISEASSANLKLVNKKYNVNLLFKQLVEMTKTKLKDKEVEFRYNIDDSIPEYLMGDSIRFKQMVAIILNNAIKHTEKGYIELDVSYVIKVDVCSFIINVIDTGKGMSQEKLNEALNSSKEVTGSDEDIATSKTLAGLSNGTIMGVSEEGKGSKFTIIVNQKIAPEEENSSIERSVLKVDSDKKILVVENDEKEQNKIIKLLKDENISIEITNMGVGCLEKIRNGSHYDLIIINEELPKLSGIMTYQKLKIINNFNIPVIMMIDKSHEEYIEKYLDLGIKKCLIKPMKKLELENIIKQL